MPLPYGMSCKPTLLHLHDEQGKKWSRKITPADFENAVRKFWHPRSTEGLKWSEGTEYRLGTYEDAEVLEVGDWYVFTLNVYRRPVPASWVKTQVHERLVAHLVEEDNYTREEAVAALAHGNPIDDRVFIENIEEEVRLAGRHRALPTVTQHPICVDFRNGLVVVFARGAVYDEIRTKLRGVFSKLELPVVIGEPPTLTDHLYGSRGYHAMVPQTMQALFLAHLVDRGWSDSWLVGDRLNLQVQLAEHLHVRRQSDTGTLSVHGLEEVRRWVADGGLEDHTPVSAMLYLYEDQGEPEGEAISYGVMLDTYGVVQKLTIHGRVDFRDRPIEAWLDLLAHVVACFAQVELLIQAWDQKELSRLMREEPQRQFFWREIPDEFEWAEHPKLGPTPIEALIERWRGTQAAGDEIEWTEAGGE